MGALSGDLVGNSRTSCVTLSHRNRMLNSMRVGVNPAIWLLTKLRLNPLTQLILLLGEYG